MPLKQEEDGQKVSGHIDDMATHLGTPPDQLTTTLPV
jgi:hypothetical protein